MRTQRRIVAFLAAPGIRAAREVYTTVPADAIRVAALVEIAAAAASLARTVVRLRRLDPDLIAPHVADVTDLRAVLGRGQWLPTMTRHVPAPATASPGVTAVAHGPVPRARSVRRRMARTVRPAGQDALFQISA